MKVYSRRQTILLKKIERKIRRSFWITQTCRDRDSQTGRCFATQYYIREKETIPTFILDAIKRIGLQVAIVEKQVLQTKYLIVSITV